MGAEVAYVAMTPGSEQQEGYPFFGRWQKTVARWFIPP